jgi:hypothetical protein
VGGRGPAAGVEGFLDVLAGDLVAADYAVGVGGEQDMQAVPGAGGDFGGRGAGGQPQRQRGMTRSWGRRGAQVPAWPGMAMWWVSGWGSDSSPFSRTAMPVRALVRGSTRVGTPAVRFLLRPRLVAAIPPAGRQRPRTRRR